MTHGGRPPRWAHWRTMEGGYVFDRQALYEAYLKLLGSPESTLATDASERLASAPAEGQSGREELGEVFGALLTADIEACPHDLPLGIDLALASPIVATPELTVVGGDEPITTRRRLSLLAGPAMGSGASAWTRAALRALDGLRLHGLRVADIGTGTGILGLYAALLGATVVDAIDVDPMSGAVARRNARANGLDDRFRVVEALDGDYDVAIVALSGAWEVPPALVAIVPRLRSGGTLVASPAEGIAECQQLEDAVREQGIAPSRVVSVDDWNVLVGERR